MIGFLLCIAVLLPQSPSAAHGQVRDQWLEWLELGQPAQVVREAAARLAKEPAWRADGRALALYSRGLSATGGSQQATELLTRAQVPASDRVFIELALARLELQQDRLASLIQRLAGKGPAPSARFPDQADSWWLLAKAHTRLGHAEQATPYLQHFVQTWRMHPQAPAAWHALAQFALARRDMEKARNYRDQGQNLATWHGYYRTRRIQVRENPKDALPRFGLAQLWSSVQEYGKASAELDTALQLDPNFARGWALRGELERAQNRQASAIKAYSRALELDPALGDARFHRARLALQTGQDGMAQADLTLIVEGPESTADRYLRAHLELVRLLRRLGKEEEARVRYARYRQLGGEQ